MVFCEMALVQENWLCYTWYGKVLSLRNAGGFIWTGCRLLQAPERNF